ncbi:MAG: hypothetical protein KDI30_06575, partial [Pseudomonadales bacterium]|nr:hypothetical protein [Pseudomonadales bacterium]
MLSKPAAIRPTSFILIVCMILLSGSGFVSADSNPYNLPELGDSTSSFISLQEEKLLGDSWLRIYRSQAPVLNDPLVTDYLENLIDELAV